MSNNSDDKKLTISVHNLTPSSCSDGALCSLDPIDISLLPDPCDNISVGIRTEQNGECNEGAVALDQLANAIGVCLGISEIDTDVSDFTVTATSQNTATFSVIEDGVSRDVFISGENIQFSGSGIDTDPFIITSLSSLSGDEGVDVSGSGTPTDPFLLSIDLCEVPTVDASSVEAEPESFIAMCIGGQNGKVMFSDFVSLPRFNTSVIGGTNATVTGSGLPSDPYVVSSPDNTVVVSGANTSVSGSGTPTDPYVVNAIIPAQQPSYTPLASPATILSVTQALSDGNFDSGIVTINLNSLAGVSVPAGSTGVMIQAAASVSGDQLQVGNTISGEFAWIEAASTAAQINGGNFSNLNAVPTLVTYVDSNLGGDDNDNTSYPIIPISGGNSIAYRAFIRYQNTAGNGLAFGQLSLRVIGFFS